MAREVSFWMQLTREEEQEGIVFLYLFVAAEKGNQKGEMHWK